MISSLSGGICLCTRWSPRGPSMRSSASETILRRVFHCGPRMRSRRGSCWSRRRVRLGNWARAARSRPRCPLRLVLRVMATRSRGRYRRGFQESAELLDVARLRRLWGELRRLPNIGPNVMSHGDLIPGNVLVRDGRLVGILDGSGLGQPILRWILSLGGTCSIRIRARS